jgi:hypothetical protein
VPGETVVAAGLFFCILVNAECAKAVKGILPLRLVISKMPFAKPAVCKKPLDVALNVPGVDDGGKISNLHNYIKNLILRQ